LAPLLILILLKSYVGPLRDYEDETP